MLLIAILDHCALVAGDKNPIIMSIGRVTSRCRYCQQNHLLDECNEFTTIEARKNRIRNCLHVFLQLGHKYLNCWVVKPCIYCGITIDHHRSICPSKFQTSTELSNIANCITSQECSIDKETSLIA